MSLTVHFYTLFVMHLSRSWHLDDSIDDVDDDDDTNQSRNRFILHASVFNLLCGCAVYGVAFILLLLLLMVLLPKWMENFFSR